MILGLHNLQRVLRTTIYAKVSRPNLFDFTRNTVFVADYPNQMSPTKCLPTLPVSSEESRRAPPAKWY